MCQKVSYGTKQEALTDAKIIKADIARRNHDRKKGGKKLRPYQCPLCGSWHLTTRKTEKWM